MTPTKRIPLAEYPARRIALIKPSALGDIVHALPVLTALRQRYPRAHLTWVVNRSLQPLLDGHPDLNATLAFDRSGFRQDPLRAPWACWQFLRLVRAAQFDLVIDLQGLLRSGLIALASGAPRRVGLAGAREGAAWCYTDIVPSPDIHSIHAVERNWLMARALGAGPEPGEFRVPVAPAARQWALDKLDGCPRPWLTVIPGSRWETKRWPPDHFAWLADQAVAHFGGTVVFVGQQDEQPLARAVARLLTGPICNLTGLTSLPQLSAVLSLADAVVANDSGPAHLAAALGRPVVAPYTCTSVRLHGPYRTAGGTVESGVWCQGSYRKRCRRLECMAELTPERLWPALQEVLQAWQNSLSPVFA